MHNLSMWYFSMLHKSSFYYPIWMIFNHYAVQSWFKGVKLTFFFGGGHFSGSTLKKSLSRFKRNLNLNYLFIHPFWCNFLSWFTYWIIWLYSFILRAFLFRSWLLSVAFWKIITALKSLMTCYNLNINSSFTSLRNL